MLDAKLPSRVMTQESASCNDDGVGNFLGKNDGKQKRLVDKQVGSARETQLSIRFRRMLDMNIRIVLLNRARCIANSAVNFARVIYASPTLCYFNLGTAR